MTSETLLDAPPSNNLRNAVTANDFRQAMSRLSAAVTIVTTDGPLGPHGMTASAVCSVTDTPATVLVCVNRSTRSHDVLREHGTLAINILGHEHQDIAMLFASSRKTMEERFASGSWHRAHNHAPVLADAITTLVCSINNMHEIGTHSVLYCTVENIMDSNQTVAGLAWFDRNFHVLPPYQNAE